MSFVPQLDWPKLKERYANNRVSHTKNGKQFEVGKVTDTAIQIDLPGGEQYVRRTNLEKAVHLINQGKAIEGPTEYKRLVYDERPTYAWAILRDAGFVK